MTHREEATITVSLRRVQRAEAVATVSVVAGAAASVVALLMTIRVLLLSPK
jgi:hypothetical protein